MMRNEVNVTHPEIGAYESVALVGTTFATAMSTVLLLTSMGTPNWSTVEVWKAGHFRFCVLWAYCTVTLAFFGARRLSAAGSMNYALTRDSSENFKSRASRGAFLRKVLGIVGLQLVIAASWTLVCIHVQEIGEFVHKWYWITFIALAVYATLFIAVGFFKLGRKCPLNIIVLIIYTMSIAYICGYVTMQYSTWILLMTLGATVVTFICLILVSLVTKLDVTGWGIYLTLAGCMFMLYISVAFLCSYLLKDKDVQTLSILNISGAFVGACLVSLYLLYDIQMIMGGRRAEVEEDEWLFASMSIFYDLIMIFVHLLQIIGLFRRCQCRR